MDECNDSTGDAQLFSILNANSGYWQIEVDKPDRERTAFMSHYGVHQVTRMPFGLKSAPATVTRIMYIMLFNVKWQLTLVYRDDNAIFSITPQEHMAHTKMVVTSLKEPGVALKLKKCAFFANCIDHLRQVLIHGRLKVAKNTADSIRELNLPKTATKLRPLLRLCDVFSWCVPNFAKIASHLSKRLKKTYAKGLRPLKQEEQNALDVWNENWFHRQSSHCPKERYSLHRTLTHPIVKSVVSCFRSKKRGKTDQLYTGHAR